MDKFNLWVMLDKNETVQYEEKIFVGGYYDTRIFDDKYFDYKTPFDKNIDSYTLSEALDLPFVKGVKDWFEEVSFREWDDASERIKIKAILKFTQQDDTAGLSYFGNEEDCEQYKNVMIEQIEEIENMSVYIGKRKDEYGFFREVYKLIEEVN